MATRSPLRPGFFKGKLHAFESGKWRENMKKSFVMPKKDTLHYLLIEKMAQPECEGVTFLDFIGTGINEQNIDGLIQDLQNGFYESDDKDHMKIFNEVKKITMGVKTNLSH